MRGIRGTLIALAICACADVVGAQQAATPSSILGRWRGTSTCVKESWNASCNDEVVVYWFAPDSSGDRNVTLRAYKIVRGALEHMGDQPLTPDGGPGRYAGNFSNARVHIRWSFQVQADGQLIGRLIDLKADGRVVRNVSARRDSTQAEPRAP